MSTRIKGLFSKKKKDEKSSPTPPASVSSANSSFGASSTKTTTTTTTTITTGPTGSSLRPPSGTPSSTLKKKSTTTTGATNTNVSQLRGQHSTSSLASVSSSISYAATNLSRKSSHQGLDNAASATGSIRIPCSDGSQTSLVLTTSSKPGKSVTQPRVQDTERTAPSTGTTTSSPVPTTTPASIPTLAAEDLISSTGTLEAAEAAEAGSLRVVTAAEDGTSVSTYDPMAINDGTMTPLSTEAATREDDAGSSSLTSPSTPSTPAPSSTTHDESKGTQEPGHSDGGGGDGGANGLEETQVQGRAEVDDSVIKELNVATVSQQGALAAIGPKHGTQNDCIPAAETPESVAVDSNRVQEDAEDLLEVDTNEAEADVHVAPDSPSYVQHGSFYSNISLRDVPDNDDMPDDGARRQYPRYLASTSEFFPVHAQDEHVFLERYSEDADGLPELQHKVGKLQRQVREVRKFMRGMIQLQVEQYEPAAVKIQAWWRGCLVRKELKRQRMFTWHRLPARNVKTFKYLTKIELQQSCDRISAPKPSIFVTAEMGAAKEVIAAVKLQAVFRACLVRRRLQAYRRGTQAAVKIQAVWRGYYTRNLDTRLSVKQLQFRNLKVQKAFGRVSLKLQYLQGRIATLEESYPVLQDAQDALTKDFDDLSDEVDKLRKDLEQGLKQMDEQAAEERELMTLELKAMTDRVKKLEDDLAKAHSSQTSTETQVKKLQRTVARLTMGMEEDLGAGDAQDSDRADGDDHEDDDYEVQYDEEGNRIERPAKATTSRRPSTHGMIARPSSSLSARRDSHDPRMMPRRTSSLYGATTAGHAHSYSEMDSPIPAQSMLHHRGSVSSVHSHHSNGGAAASSAPAPPPPPPHPTRQASMPVTGPRPISASSVPGSPDQMLPRGAFPSSYSPTITHAQTHHPRSHSRQGSVQFSTTTGTTTTAMATPTDGNSSFSGGGGGGGAHHHPHHHHSLHNPHRHSMMAAFPPTNSAAAAAAAAAANAAATQQAAMMADSKKYASQDDFEYMQAEVDTLRINNDKLEALVRDLTAKVNLLMGAASGSSALTPIISSAQTPASVLSSNGGYFPSR